MRITCATVPEFIDNLKAGTGLFRNTIWCSIHKRPEGDNPHDAVKFQIVIQMSAVVVYDEGEEALVEVGVDCGWDYTDSGGSYKGTERAQDLRQQAMMAVEEKGWRMLPGMLDT